MSIVPRAIAEFLGTFWLVLIGAGSAVLAAAYPEVGIGFLGVAIAFGLALLTAAYAIGRISGCHVNPAVSIGLWTGGRFKALDLLPYVLAQVAGAIVAGGVLYIVASGKAGFDADASFAANGFGDHSPDGYSLGAALLTEIVLTAVFVFVILQVTAPSIPAGQIPEAFAPIAIGLTLLIIHLFAIPVDNASVNPARSTGTAVYVGGWAIEQLWLFWVAPIAGAAVGGLLHRWLAEQESAM